MRMSLRAGLGLAVPVFAAWHAGCGTEALGPEQPNIVVVIADDLDEEMLQVARSRGFMPQLDAIESGGTRFNDSFATLSLCAPSRATFLTGQYSHNHGVLTNTGMRGGVNAFKDSSTVATWLSGAGYRTGHIGKYLNDYGVDGANGVGQRNSKYIPPGWTSWQGLVDPTTYQVYRYKINDNGNIVSYGGPPGKPDGDAANYQTDVLAQRAKKFIEDSTDPDVPLFLVVTPLAPHNETNDEVEEAGLGIRPAPRHEWVLDLGIGEPAGPAFNEDDVTDKPTAINGRLPQFTPEQIAANAKRYGSRVASLLAVDDLIGTIRSTLEASGRLNNTVFIFQSDNGYLEGQHRLHGKPWIYEESLRVPLIYRDFRTNTNPSSVTGRAVLNNDLAPTIAALAGVTPGQTVDGRSFLPLLQNPNDPNWRARLYTSRYDPAKVNFYGVRTTPLDSFFPNQVYAKHIYPRLPDKCGISCEEWYLLDSDPYELTSQQGVGGPGMDAMRKWTLSLHSCKGVGGCARLEDCVDLAACGL